IVISHDGLVAAGLQNFTVRTGAGNDMLLDYAPDYHLPVSGGAFRFEGGGGTDALVGGSPGLNANLTLYNVEKNSPVPVIFIPGFGGSFATTSATTKWFNTVGLQPSELQIDPFLRAYDDLVKSLNNAGYVQGQSLFLAPWDWRLPVALEDATIDGTLSKVTTTELTSGTFADGVDYLGDALKRAAAAWAQAYDGRALPAVDVITHSTGGLIARAYVQ